MLLEAAKHVIRECDAKRLRFYGGAGGSSSGSGSGAGSGGWGLCRQMVISDNEAMHRLVVLLHYYYARWWCIRIYKLLRYAFRT